MAKANKNVKSNVLPHSRAKLELYKSYLKMYLPILGYSQYVTAINVFDIFCGTGIYDDGNMGSPLIAASCIQEYEAQVSATKPVRLFINDFEESKVSTVKELIEKLELKNCDIQAFNLDAADMFKVTSSKINAFPKSERSLVFIDPYGYSKITKEGLLSILQKGKSEIILFLPVAHMKRFTEDALTDRDNKAYTNLRRFINDFLPDNSPVKQGIKLNVFDYIEELRKAFSFNGTYYTASHYIERDPANYYSLYFIGSHIYGLEKFVEAKWGNARLGKGFNQKDNTSLLFADLIEEVDRNVTIQNLEKLFREFLDANGSVTNRQLYEFTLRNQFKPAHMNEVLKNWSTAKRMQVYNAKGDAVTSTRSFGLTHDHYKDENIAFVFKKRS